MALYYLTLGTNPELSQAEIINSLNINKIPYSVQAKEKDFFMFTTDSPKFNAENFIYALGGTIKIGKIHEIKKNLEGFNYLKLLPKLDKKLNFGVSQYNFKNPSNKIGLSLKKQLKAQDISARFVTSQISPLSSVIVQKDILNKQGVEFCLFQNNNSFYLGTTIAVQDFKSYSILDYGRPKRDTQAGMLPPKLAKIMINLAGKPTHKKILDPFCGAGTVLQQAMLLDYRNVFGSDKSNKQINSTIKNLNWMQKELGTNFFYKVYTQNVEKLTETFQPNSIDFIVTEPYLGPAITGKENADKIRKIVRELAQLYKKAFISFGEVLNKQGVIVIVIPEIKGEQIDPKGFMTSDFKILNEWLYYREGQFVKRHIYKIVKK